MGNRESFTRRRMLRPRTTLMMVALLLPSSAQPLEEYADMYCSGDDGCWPRVWLLGSQKSGTTSLYMYLRARHRLCGAKLVGVNEGKNQYFCKETKFWAREGKAQVWKGRREEAVRRYLELHPQSQLNYAVNGSYPCENGFIEGDTQNLLDLEVPAALAAVVPLALRSKLKFMAVLREPVSRDMSWYNHARAMRYNNSICDPVAFPNYSGYAHCFLNKTDVNGDAGLWHGVYQRQLSAWAHAFPRTNLLVLAMDFLLGDPDACTDLIANFLDFHGAAPSPVRRLADSLPLANSRPHAEDLSCDLRDALDAFYDPWNQKLYAMLDAHQAHGLAPSLEPPFPRFQRQPCRPSASVVGATGVA